MDCADSDVIEQVSSGSQVTHNDFTPQLERWKLAEFFYFQIRRGLVLGRHALILSTRNRNGTNYVADMDAEDCSEDSKCGRHVENPGISYSDTSGILQESYLNLNELILTF